jgi:hypothetical protein
MTGVIKVNETARAFARGKAEGNAEIARLRGALAQITDQYQIGLAEFSKGWSTRQQPGTVIFGWNNAEFTVDMFQDALAALAGDTP